MTIVELHYIWVCLKTFFNYDYITKKKFILAPEIIENCFTEVLINTMLILKHCDCSFRIINQSERLKSAKHKFIRKSIFTGSGPDQSHDCWRRS